MHKVRATHLQIVLVLATICTLVRPINGLPTSLPLQGAQDTSPPNFVIFHVDDLGYGDLNVYGHPTTYTPNIDMLYQDGGIKFTQTITPDSVCTPNRVALLTGRYPIRSGFADNFYRVLYDPSMPSHIPFNETTFGTALKTYGYRTSLFGKWHAGLNIDSYDDGKGLPMTYGFDYYYGVPYGMNPYNDPEDPMPGPSTLYENYQLIQQPTYMYNFTSNMNKKIIHWIDESIQLSLPMLIHINYLQVHTPMFASEGFQNKTRRGSFGDDLLEVDSSIGMILDHMKLRSLDKNTVYFFLSDNGPYAEEGLNGGSRGLLKGNKGQTWEGGHRTPFIVRYKRFHEEYAHVPNIIHMSPRSTMDVFPTMIMMIQNITNVNNIQKNQITYDMIDGKMIDLKKIYQEGTDHKPQESDVGARLFYYYCGQRILAVRSGSYKIHFHTQNWLNRDLQSCKYVEGREYGVCGCTEMDTEPQDPPLMFNLDHDPSEGHVLSPDNFSRYQEILEWITERMQVHEDNVIPVENQMTKIPRPSLEPCCNYPVCCCDHHTCETL